MSVVTVRTVANTARRMLDEPRRPARSDSRAASSASHPAAIMPAIIMPRATSARPEKLTSWLVVLSRVERPRMLRALAIPTMITPRKSAEPIRREGPPV